MNFTEMVDEVLLIVKRPDKTAEAQREINNAITFFTLKNKLARDMVEQTISVSSSLYGDTVDLSALLTRFRDFSFVKITGKRGYLTRTGANQVFQPGGQMQRNVYYVHGVSMTYILSELTSTLDVGYYQYPPILTGTDTHWLSDVIPWAIINKAAAKMFSNIGDDASARRKEGDAMELYEVLVGDLALQN